MSQKRSNQCLIDYIRCSIPNSELPAVADGILGIPISEFSSEIKNLFKIFSIKLPHLPISNFVYYFQV
ncbi:hypothetical protein NPM06_32415, partial [Bacillus cereus]|nr:hypothetical protein [Bacillus cereus]